MSSPLHLSLKVKLPCGLYLSISVAPASSSDGLKRAAALSSNIGAGSLSTGSVCGNVPEDSQFKFTGDSSRARAINYPVIMNKRGKRRISHDYEPS